ncbi:MAG: RHS repeat-associated core domain-containing protein [Simkaniaceae bacterium]
MRWTYLLIPCFLFSLDTDQTFLNATFESSSSIVVENSVNAITGRYYISEEDLVVQGKEPLKFRRNYTMRTKSGFDYFPHLILDEETDYETKEKQLSLFLPSGAQFYFEKDEKQFKPKLEENHPGLTNRQGARYDLSRMVINWEPEHNIYELQLPNGGVRYYGRHQESKKKKSSSFYAETVRGFILVREVLPNGNQIFYQYDEKRRPTKIATTSPSGKIEYASLQIFYGKDKSFLIKTSDDREYKYEYEKQTIATDKTFPEFLTRASKRRNEKRCSIDATKKTPFLKRIIRSDRLNEVLFYGNYKDEEEHYIRARTIEGSNQYIGVEYYRYGINQFNQSSVILKEPYDSRIGRVAQIKAPAGKNGEEVGIHTFFYHFSKTDPQNDIRDKGYTEVYNSEGQLTRYYFDKNLREQQIIRYFQGEEVRKESFHWDDETGRLKKKEIFDHNQPIATFIYAYDTDGNMTKKVIKAQDQSSYITTYTYTPNHLVKTHQTPDGISYSYTYLGQTDNITSKLTLYEGEILERNYYHYDEENNLIRKIEDNGSHTDQDNLQDATKRLITDYSYQKGLPVSIESKALDLFRNEEILLKKEERTYNNCCQVIEEKHFDSKNQHLYTLYYTYDKARHLTSKTDPLGNKTSYTYDRLGNKIKEETSFGLITNYFYDRVNRCIKMQKKLPDGEMLETETRYDTKSRKTAQKSPTGHWTYYHFDGLDNIEKIIMPETPAKTNQLERATLVEKHNALSQTIKKVDALGNQILILPNLFGKPLQIIYPDRTLEKYSYDLAGRVTSHTDREGRTTLMSYTPLGQLKEKHYPDGTREYNIYNREEKIGEVNRFGLHKQITYDPIGRILSEREPHALKTEYVYDTLGRVEQKVISAPELLSKTHIIEYDLLNRPLVEYDEDEQGQTIFLKKMTYNEQGKKETETKYINGQEAITTYHYDALGRLAQTISPLKQTTTIEYKKALNEHHQLVEKTITTNSIGRKEIEIYDTMGRIALKKRLSEEGEQLQKEEYTYDLNGNCLMQTSHLGEHLRKTLWAYNENNQKTALTEAFGTPDERTTQMRSTPYGQILEIIKPDGCILETTYDKRDRKKTQYSSDGTIDYTYTYDLHDKPIQIFDAVNELTTIRSYDPRGNLLSETLGTGYTLNYKYDAYDRRIEVQLPDETSIEYTYDGYFLRKITRRLKQASYTHTYDTYDLSLNPIEESAIMGLGHIHRRYNKHNYETQHVTPCTLELHTRNPQTDNLEMRTLQINGDYQTTNYSYDSLDQLIEERGQDPHTYAYDAHYNRTQKDEQPYHLDELNQIQDTPTGAYTYDLNGNPKTLTTDTTTTTYTYDAFNRLIQIETPNKAIRYTYDADHRRLSKETPIENEHYLYVEQDDIGTLQEKHLKHLRVLGLGRGAEIGAAVAIEIDGKVHLPLHSIFGNLLTLYNPKTKKITTPIRYTLFGESSPPTAPWGYQSKRYDEDANLYFFGRRYYDPQTGRFFTPDPKGFETVPNLYPFALNNPSLHYDLYGLSSICLPNGDSVNLFHYPTLDPMENGYPRTQYMSFEPPYSTEPSTYLDYERSACFDLDRPPFPDKKILNAYVNGMNTPYETCVKNAEYLSDLTGGYNVYCLYNPTHAKSNDINESYLGLKGYINEGELAFKNFLESKILEGYTTINLIGHSQGAIKTYNLLAMMKPEDRNYIRALTIAGAKFIPPELAREADNVITDGFDPVPRMQRLFKSRDNLSRPRITKVLKAEGEPYWDHAFQSKTYQKSIYDFIFNED